MTPRLSVRCTRCGHTYGDHHATRGEYRSLVLSRGEPDCSQCSCPAFTARMTLRPTKGANRA